MLSLVQFSLFMSMKRSSIITTNYKSVKSTFAHGGDSEKTKRSLKSAATALIKFDNNHSHTVTSDVHILNIYISMKYRHNKNQSSNNNSKKTKAVIHRRKHINTHKKN